LWISGGSDLIVHFAMNPWERNKLKSKVRQFGKGLMRCDQCHTILSIEGLAPLSLMRCGRCKCMNVIPMLLADFWLHQPLGGGGSGVVYLAYWLHRGKRCAVKVLRSGENRNDNTIAGLQKEASTLADVGRHPCIVRLLSSGISNDECFMAMEYIEGERLDNRIARLGTIPEKEALRMLLYLLAAEKHIFRRGYLYGDMKPENIIFKQNNLPVLIDFGMCMKTDEAARRKKAFVGGSPYYLPPERLQKDPEGPYSEIYALGMIMYTALTSGTFFKFTGNVQDLAMKHIQTARMSVTQAMLPMCNPATVEMLGRMIRKDPSERYQTFEEVELVAMQIFRRIKR